MKESELQRRCLAMAKRLDVLAVNVHGSGWSAKGFPDLLLFHEGKCIAVELKADSGYAVQDDQIVWRNRLLRQGIAHHIARSESDFAEILEGEFEL